MRISVVERRIMRLDGFDTWESLRHFHHPDEAHRWVISHGATAHVTDNGQVEYHAPHNCGYDTWRISQVKLKRFIKPRATGGDAPLGEEGA